ncbi:HEAT repeat-containing protein 5B, partial [Coemansia guatemalensis]
TAAAYVVAVQRQFLFASGGGNVHSTVLRFVQLGLRPVLRARWIAYYGASVRPLSLQRVAVAALESVLRLYGSQLLSAAQLPLDNEGVSAEGLSGGGLLCEIVWDATCLHSALLGSPDSESQLLVGDLQALVRTAVALALGADGMQLPMIETLCAIITRFPSPLLPPLNHIRSHADGSKDGAVNQGAGATVGGGSADSDGDEATAQFGARTRQLALAALLSAVDAVAEDAQKQLLPLLPDMLRVGYLAASLAERLPTLGCLGLRLLQRLVDLFASVDDPKMPEDSVLVVYQAQLDSALAATLPAASASECRVREKVRRAAIALATSYLLAPRLVRDRADMLRLLRHLAPQPAFEERSRAKDKRVWQLPMQLRVVERLAILRVWARLLLHASNCERGRRLTLLKESLLLHLPLLVEMWLAAVRDAAVVQVDTREVCEELETLNLAQLRLDAAENGGSSNHAVRGPVDVGLGLLLGLDSADLRLVRRPMAACFRYHLPPIVDALALLLDGSEHSSPSSLMAGADDDWLASGRSELLRQLEQSSDRAVWLRISGNHGDIAPSKSALLILCAGLQHLPRSLLTPAAATNAKQIASLAGAGGGDDTCDPFIAETVRSLIGVLDIDRSHDSEDVALTKANPAALAKLRMSRSLLTMVATLLSYNDRLHLGKAFSASADDSEAPWLLRELWVRAVTTQLQTIAQLDGIAFAAASGEDCGLGLDVALKSMEVADCLMQLDLQSAEPGDGKPLPMLRRWLLRNTNASLLEGSVEADEDADILLSLDCAIGCFTPFGAAVLRDIMTAWKGARSIMFAEDAGFPEAQRVATAALRVLARVIAMALGGGNAQLAAEPLAALEKLWLGMWSQSVANHLASAETASELLSFFVGLVDNGSSQAVDDLVTGDRLDDANLMRPSLMHTANALLAQRLLEDAEDEESNDNCGQRATTALLVVVARLCCGSTAFEAHPIVRQRFVDAFCAQVRGCLDSEPSDSVIRMLEEVPACFGRQKNGDQQSAELLVLIARESIPLLARLVYGPGRVAQAALNALVYFASASGYEPQDDAIATNIYTSHAGVLATVLMLLLAMLPSADTVDAALDDREQLVAESVLGLATKCPTLFKDVVRVLAAAHPDAKRRLEVAIRYGAGVTGNGNGQQRLRNNSTAITEPSVDVDLPGATEHPAIVLKSNFGF